MRVLGISAFFHDSSAAIVEDGRVIATAAEERFSLQKHDPNFPRFAIEYCLEAAGITAQELDAIVFYEEPHSKFTRVLATNIAGFPATFGNFINSMSAWMGSKLWVKDLISKRLNVHPAKIQLVPHHLSHAAQAFAAGPFPQSAILVVDAVGEWGSTSLFKGAFENGELKITPVETIPFPHSLGLIYAAFTGFLGFKVNDGECNTMALATFGKPTYVDKVRKVILAQQDGTYRLDPSYFRFDGSDRLPLTDKFFALFGAPRHFKSPLPFDCLSTQSKNTLEAGKDARYYADIAASVQVVLEETLLGLSKKLHQTTGMKNLCFAGGVALNCVANGKLAMEGPFEDVFIPPDPGDGGAAMGAALLGYSLIGGRFPEVRGLTPYLGKQFDERRDIEMLNFSKPQYWARHRFLGSPQPEGLRLDIRHFEDFSSAIDSLVDDLANGKVVGWIQGRFENGPRALGNRSLLTDPGNIDAARRLSSRIKSRASFRPYALSMTPEDATRIIDFPGKLPTISKWMQMAVPVKSSAREKISAGVHSNGTTRPHVCTKEENARYHELLTAFGKRSGYGALLNTSFNPSGLPLASSPAEGLLQYINTDLDTLVINNTVIRKVVP